MSLWKKLVSALESIGKRSKNYHAANAVKPHIPLIKFPPRGSIQTGTQVNQAPGQMNTIESLVADVVSRSGAATSASARKSAIDSTELPLKYQRREISMEEIEYIEKGGQV